MVDSHVSRLSLCHLGTWGMRLSSCAWCGACSPGICARGRLSLLAHCHTSFSRAWTQSCLVAALSRLEHLSITSCTSFDSDNCYATFALLVDQGYLESSFSFSVKAALPCCSYTLKNSAFNCRTHRLVGLVYTLIDSRTVNMIEPLSPVNSSLVNSPKPSSVNFFASSMSTFSSLSTNATYLTSFELVFMLCTKKNAP